MLKNTVFIMAIILVFNGSALAGRSDSKEIYAYSRKIAEIAGDEIWPGFAPLKYTSVKSADGKDFISFSAGENFKWTLTDEYFAAHSLEENLVITFHEAFHAFQKDAERTGVGWGAENAFLVFEYQETSARHNTLFGIEAQILHEALEMKDKKSLIQKIAEFLAVRRLRQSELDARFAEFEKGAELNEGLAEYAGTKAVAVAMKSGEIPFEKNDAGEFLREKYKILSAINGLGKNVRLKFYYTGSAQGFLLDRLVGNWKAKVQTEAVPVQDLLAGAVGKTLAADETKKLLAEYDYEKILTEEIKRVAARKAENQKLLKNTLAQTGRKLTIDYSNLGKPAGIRFFDPMNVTLIDPELRVHTRSVTFAADASLTAEFSQPVVEDLKNRRYTAVLSAIESLEADGKTLDPAKTGALEFNESLVLQTAGLKLKARKGRLKLTDGGIEITVLD